MFTDYMNIFICVSEKGNSFLFLDTDTDTDAEWCFWNSKFEAVSFRFFWFYRIRYIWIVCIIFQYYFQNQPNQGMDCDFLVFTSVDLPEWEKSKINRERNGWNEEPFECVCEKT